MQRALDAVAFGLVARHGVGGQRLQRRAVAPRLGDELRSRENPVHRRCLPKLALSWRQFTTMVDSLQARRVTQPSRLDQTESDQAFGGGQNDLLIAARRPA